jgi:uncharacterized membrane protein YcaP (DUF421 family)
MDCDTLGDFREEQSLREQGTDKLAQVKRCYMEPSGTVSIIKFKDDGDKPDAEHGNKIAGT